MAGVGRNEKSSHQLADNVLVANTNKPIINYRATSDVERPSALAEIGSIFCFAIGGLFLLATIALAIAAQVVAGAPDARLLVFTGLGVSATFIFCGRLLMRKRSL